jgi:hypothetical protein
VIQYQLDGESHSERSHAAPIESTGTTARTPSASGRNGSVQLPLKSKSLKQPLAPEVRNPILPNESSYRVIRGKHTVLTGTARGRYVCVCLQCGNLMAIVPSISLVSIIDRFHDCPGAARKF